MENIWSEKYICEWLFDQKDLWIEGLETFHVSKAFVRFYDSHKEMKSLNLIQLDHFRMAFEDKNKIASLQYKKTFDEKE